MLIQNLSMQQEPWLATNTILSLLLLLLLTLNGVFATDLSLEDFKALMGPLRAKVEAIGDFDEYRSNFHLFPRGIVGRATLKSGELENNKPQVLNLQPGQTACYLVRSNVIFGDSASVTSLAKSSGDGASPPSETAPASGRVNRTLYLSANTCLQPLWGASGSKPQSPPQLRLSVSNSSASGCPSYPSDAAADDGRDFDEGAVMYSLNATGDVYVSITAQNISSTDFKGLYSFEVAASQNTFYHQYQKGGPAQLLWMDSDSTSALLITRNLTDDDAQVWRIMTEELPFELFVSNKDFTASAGLSRSVCGLRNTAQITANRLSSSRPNSPVLTAMTRRGPGGFPKQQFYFVALNASSSYTGVLVKSANITTNGKRQLGNPGNGSIVFDATEFSTVSGTTCKVVTDLDFCQEIQYAVPGNDRRFNNTGLAKAYDDYARSMYANFEKAMMQIQCEASKTSLYSLARTCNDCKTAYKRWLCTVSLPRCEDFGTGNHLSLIRNAMQAFPNGTRLPDAIRAPLEQKPYSSVSRNPFIDQTIQPGPYREILPCEDICYEVVQSCPAAIGFTCPQPGMVSFQYSYGQRDDNSSMVSCNFPGEARTPMNGGSHQSPDFLMLYCCCVCFSLLLLLG